MPEIRGNFFSVSSWSLRVSVRNSRSRLDKRDWIGETLTLVSRLKKTLSLTSASNILTLIGIFHLDCCARSEYSKIFHLDLCSCSGARLLAVQADESSLQQVWVDHWWRGADSNISSNSCSNLSMEKTSLMMTTTFRWCRAPRLVVEPLPCGRWPGRSNSHDVTIMKQKDIGNLVKINN